MTEPSLVLIAALCLVVALGLWRALKSPQERSWSASDVRHAVLGGDERISIVKMRHGRPVIEEADNWMLGLEPNWDWPVWMSYFEKLQRQVRFTEVSLLPTRMRRDLHG